MHQCGDKELLSNTRCNPVNFDCNDGSEGFKNASKAQKKTGKKPALKRFAKLFQWDILWKKTQE